MIPSILASLPLLLLSVTASASTYPQLTHVTKWEKAKELPKKVKSSTSYSQGNATIQEAISYIQTNGSTLTDITLTSVNNALIQACKSSCPNLSSFSIHAGLNGMELGLSDTGLITIGSFPQLTSLVLDIWFAEKLSTQGLLKLLNQQTSLQTLYISHPAFNDDCISLLTEYDPLSELTIYTVSVTDTGYSTLLASQALQGSLETLDMHIGSSFTSMNYIDDTLVTGLASFKALSRLSLHGTWTAQSANVVTLLQSLPNLIDVDFYGFPMDSAVAAELAQMPITTLALSDCSQLGETDFTTMLTALTNLTSLNLGSCTYLSNTNATQIASLSLTSLSLTGNQYMWNAGITAIGRSPTLQKSLSDFEFSGNDFIWSASFGHLNSLPLQTLRIMNCRLFNDTSMHALFNGSIAKSLQGLELCNVSISDIVMRKFSSFSNLNTLMIAECGGLTASGIKTLLNLTPFTSQITKLYFDSVVMSPKIVPLLGNFTNIEILIIGNPLEIDLFSRSRLFFKLPNVKKNHAQLELYAGELTKWKDFVNP